MISTVQLRISNQTGDPWFFGLCCQDPDLPGMFRQVFPLYWRVMPLATGSDWTLEVGPELAIGVHEWHAREAHTGASARAGLNRRDARNTRREAKAGDQWHFAVDSAGFPRLEPIEEPREGTAISGINRADKVVDWVLYRDELPLLIREEAGKGDRVRFGQSGRWWVVYGDQMRDGELVRQPVEAPWGCELDLVGARDIQVVLQRVPGPAREKKWLVDYR